MSSYYRTQALRTTHYFPNGEGRDTYIYTNNGGVERNTYPYNFKEDSRVTRRNFAFGSPNLGAKPLKYKSNGTGRDTYIAFNHGGLMSPGSRQTFYTSLRSPSPVMPAPMYKTQTYWQYAKQTKVAKIQRDACFRLSIPKFSNKNF